MVSDKGVRELISATARDYELLRDYYPPPVAPTGPGGPDEPQMPQNTAPLDGQ